MKREGVFVMTAPLLEQLEPRVFLSASACPDISGEWQATETVIATLSGGGQVVRQTYSGTDTVTIYQEGSHVWYDRELPGSNQPARREGTIQGTRVTLTGIFAAPLAGDVVFTSNTCTITGIYSEDDETIRLTGWGLATGYAYDLPFVCRGTSKAELFRNRFKVSLSDARMIGASTLGVRLSFRAPAYYSAQFTWLDLQGVINGRPLQKRIDITSYVRPGKTVALSGLPDSAGRAGDATWSINFADPNGDGSPADALPRFEEDLTFALTATVSSSNPDVKPGAFTAPNVRVPLPIVFVHGYTGPPTLRRMLLSPVFNLAIQAQNAQLSRFLAGETNHRPFQTPYSAEARAPYRTYLFDRYDDLFGTPAEVRQRLQDTITQALQGTYASRVNLITHSTGGLVSRYYLATTPAPKVRELIMVACPNNGLSDAYLATSGFNRTQVDTLVATTVGGFLVPRSEVVFLPGAPQGCSLLESTFVPLDLPPPADVTVTNIYTEPVQNTTPWFVNATVRRQDVALPPQTRWYRFTVRSRVPGDGTVAAASARWAYAGVNRPLPTLCGHAALFGDRLVRAELRRALGLA
jgi:pimeloyl-ACP methyl ester carboxylesterase